MKRCEMTTEKLLVSFIRDYYCSNEIIPLHAPIFTGNELDYVKNTIATTFVSSVGNYVDRFESDISRYTGADKAVATVNGTAALHVALKLAHVGPGDLVLTQPITFVATCNAISYCGAEPVFIDVDKQTLGLSANSLEQWLYENTKLDHDGICRSIVDNRVIKACLPMHTFGHPVDLDKICKITNEWNITLIEDAAESLGSLYKGKHTGTFGAFGTLSFNGNKIITTGGGGMLLTDNTSGKLAKHLTTTAKMPHRWEYNHDEVGYNYRLPNLNAALGCAQLEKLEDFILAKRSLANLYEELLNSSNLEFVNEPEHCKSNFWLNAVICEDKSHRDNLLKLTNNEGIYTRPVWSLMNHLPMYSNARSGDLSISEWLAERIVNLPSSVMLS